MQGQRSTVDSFPGMEQGSIPNSTGTSQQPSWNNMVNPVEGRLSNYILSPSGTNFTRGDAVDHDVHSFSGWNLGESSSSLNRDSRIIDDGAKMGHNWSSSFGSHAGAGPRSEERRLEPSDNLPHESVDVSLHDSQVTNRPSLFHSSSSTHRIPQNVNLSVGYICNGNNVGQSLHIGGHTNPYRSGWFDTEQNISATDNVGISSGSSGQLMDENEAGSSSSASWGSSCKRKALEGTSHHSYPGGSSACFLPSDNNIWPAVPARYNASGSLSISSGAPRSVAVGAPPTNTPTGSPPEHLNSSIGAGIRALASDTFPSSGVTGNAESSSRNFNRRGAFTYQRESPPFNLSLTGNAIHSNACLPHQSSRPARVSDSLHMRSTARVAGNTSAPQGQSHVMNISGFSRNLPSFPWNGSSSSRVGSSSNSVNLLGERGVLRDEAVLRGNPRNNTEYPMFVSATDTRNVAQDPTNWSLSTGNSGNPGAVPSTSQIGPGASAHTLPTPGWLPSRNSPAQNQQRLSEFSPWSLFPSVDTESGVQSDPFTSFSSGPSASSQEARMSSGSSSQGRQLFSRSAFMAERQSDDVFGSSHSFRALAADIEGRHRLISEIRQVLSAMRRGEQLRAEDYMLFDPFIYHGMADLHDRHRDMRLDVDSMSYEELLALEERIGDVKTGLNEETILKLLKQRKFTVRARSDLEPCCICQEEYGTGDDLGTLACGHDFHAGCIKQWLMQKNLCPICKTTALVT